MSSDGELLSCVPGGSRDRTPPARLPSPGPTPLRLAPETVVILIVIIVSVLWLLAAGYGAAVALGIIAVAARLAGGVAVRLASSSDQPAQ